MDTMTTTERSFDVSYHPPALANHHLPIQITGQGTLKLSAQGLEVSGFKVGSKGRNALVVLGFFGGFVGIIAIAIALNLGDDYLEALVALGIALGAVAYSVINKMPVKEGGPITYAYSWDQVSKVQWDMASKSLLIVIKKATPTGGIYIPCPQGSELELALNQALQARKS